ncbi:MAG TPA: hypothetical protein VIS74_07440 [Chthoniobacterales bacterium]
MKNLILHNWQAKLICLLLAIALWIAIKQNIPRPAIERRPPASLTPKHP